MASGRFEMKTATNIAKLTVPASNIPKPITIDSGTPSRMMANTMGTTNRECGDTAMSTEFPAPKRAISRSLK